MALLPAVMSLFGGRTAAPAPATPVVQQQQVASASTNPTVPSPATPQSNGSVPAIPAAGTGDGSPLAGFADLWKADPNNATPNQASMVPNFNLDPAGLMAAAQKVNFVQHLNQEQVQKAMSGDAAAFLDVINQVSQLGFANATAASGELIRNSLTSAQGVLRDQVLPSAFRDQQISQEFQNNPVFNDPAVAPLLGMVRTQLSQKYPNASPAEIAGMATRYMDGISQRVVTATGGSIVPQGQGNKTGFRDAAPTDWTAYLQG